MARMLLSVLNKSGYNAFLASRYISYSKRPGVEYLEQRKRGAQEEAHRIIAQWKVEQISPDLWFCYHPYDKSPDWLGMEICAALDIPMITAEPCKTGQGPNGEWVPWRREAQAGIKMAAMNIVMTGSDMAYLKTFVPAEKISWLPPFIDAEILQSAKRFGTGIANADIWPQGRKLLSVGMMRPGAKMDSYQLLSSALQTLKDENWSLVIVGSGPCSQQVEALFEWDTQSKVTIVGEASPEEVLALMEQAQVLAWPGCREAYGMVYLEAASRNCPSVALNNMGVPLVVEHEFSGLLADPPKVQPYAECLRKIIRDDALLAKLSASAGEFARNHRSANKTATRLHEIIEPVLKKHGV